MTRLMMSLLWRDKQLDSFEEMDARLKPLFDMLAAAEQIPVIRQQIEASLANSHSLPFLLWLSHVKVSFQRLQALLSLLKSQTQLFGASIAEHVALSDDDSVICPCL